MRYTETLQNARELRKNQTHAEKLFWEKVRGKKFLGLKFNRQYILEYTQIMGNKLYYIADFHHFENKIIVEIEGSIHQQQLDYDKERQENIEALGYKLIRFTNDEVLYQWDDVERRLIEFITR